MCWDSNSNLFCAQFDSASFKSRNIWKENLLRFLFFFFLPCWKENSPEECFPFSGFSHFLKKKKTVRREKNQSDTPRDALQLLLESVFVIVVKVKDLPHTWRGWLYRFSFSRLGFLTLLPLEGWILHSAMYDGIVSLFPLLTPTLWFAPWSDKLRHGKGCGSLNQHSLHALSVGSPFFSKGRKKQPQLPTCQQQMSHGQPLDFSQRLYCGWARRPLAENCPL